MLCINPGAAGNYGIHFVKTIVYFDVDKEKIKNLNIVELSEINHLILSADLINF